MSPSGTERGRPPAGPAPVFLTAQWRNLVLLSYEVDPAILARRVPSGTELDSFGGRAFVSLVAFQFLHTRVLGVAVPFHRDFEEINLRFYVRRAAADEVRRGVVFLKEIVPRAAIAWVARRIYHENYIALPTRSECALPAAGGAGSGSLRYEWRQGGDWSHAFAEVRGAGYTPDPASLEAFITEHHWGYAAQPDGGTLEYQVEHPRWQVWRASRSELACDVGALYGAEFVGPLSRPPASALVADGTRVVVRRGVRLPAPGAR